MAEAAENWNLKEKCVRKIINAVTVTWC